jgi:cytochrome c oxidase subunit 4
MSKPENKAASKPASNGKHIVAFLIMIVLTAIAFYLVATDVVPNDMILPFLLILAVIQVFLQLFTFMHLSERGSAMYTLFMISGIFCGVISAVGIILM